MYCVHCVSLPCYTSRDAKKNRRRSLAYLVVKRPSILAAGTATLATFVPLVPPPPPPPPPPSSTVPRTRPFPAVVALVGGLPLAYVLRGGRRQHRIDALSLVDVFHEGMRLGQDVLRRTNIDVWHSTFSLSRCITKVEGTGTNDTLPTG